MIGSLVDLHHAAFHCAIQGEFIPLEVNHEEAAAREQAWLKVQAQKAPLMPVLLALLSRYNGIDTRSLMFSVLFLVFIFVNTCLLMELW